MNEDNAKMRAWKYLPILVLILSVFLFVQTINSIKGYRYIGGGGIPDNVITVSGEGEVFAVPDVGEVSFSVSQTAKNVQDAQKNVTKKVDEVLAKVKTLGIEEKDIKTIDYSVFPKYDYQSVICTQFSCPPAKQTLLGYEVTHTVLLKVRKVEDSGKILGALGESEVTNVSGLSFTVDDEDALLREARQKAIAQAKGKAKELAKDLGVRLVRIVSFSESGAPTPIFFKSAAFEGGGIGGAEPAPTIPTGENKITANVMITYEIR
ncbi:DUF541 domain-containing protein [Patescibacteria group bacterium]|nr:MAG: DUF541 domain-containing protein [Patescibacteria group bacterium]